MSVERPYCPACGCYTLDPDQCDLVGCNAVWHGRPLTISPRFKPGGRAEKRSRRRPWQGRLR